MHQTDTAQDATKASMKTEAQEFCTLMQALTQERYQRALAHCHRPLAPNGTDTDTGASPSSVPLVATTPLAAIASSSPSLPCSKIYRNWLAEDLQRQEKQLSVKNDDDSDTSTTRFLLSYPAEKYGLNRDHDFSPIVNQHFNLLGLFFCATAALITPTAGEGGEGGEEVVEEMTAPVKTSPYGNRRYQVPFEDLEARLFPEFRLYFADYYFVRDDWYVQLLVVPSWNSKLDEQCRSQGLIPLDIDSNPFFFRSVTGRNGVPHANGNINANGNGNGHHDKQAHKTHPLTNNKHEYKYRACSQPKFWTELIVGCDVIPTSEVGEVVECLLHERVRKTTNTVTVKQLRTQLATILEGISVDLAHLAGPLRDTALGAVMDEIRLLGQKGDVESEGEGEGEDVDKKEEEKEEKELARLLGATYRLSRERTRMGIQQSSVGRTKVALEKKEEKHNSTTRQRHNGI
ncbi:hypothetical protein BGX33_006264 [Mortierella sp. NVP41]|nr:hypothetical protein BGX33_006264 [Mortierella sp. NVP41]